MRILYLNSWIHPKNLKGLELLHHTIDKKDIPLQISQENLNILLDSIDLSVYDLIYSPSVPIDVSKYPRHKFIFGPHLFNQSMDENPNIFQLINHPNTIYIQPSEWAKLSLKKNTKHDLKISLKPFPFPVDIERFDQILPINQRPLFFIYFKARSPEDYRSILQFLLHKNININHVPIFDYGKRYDETEYLNCLHHSKFGIWVDAHESQGFALQEALSCNVPLFVWNVTSLKQEFGGNHKDNDQYATTIPYWDERCGESFTDISEIETKFATFLSKLDQYKPREYVLENLSPEICSKRLEKIIHSSSLDTDA